MKKTKQIFFWVCTASLYVTCKPPASGKKSSLRDINSVNVSAEFQIVNSHVKVHIKDTNGTIANLSGVISGTQKTVSDLTVLSTGELALPGDVLIHVTADVSTSAFTNAKCNANNVVVSTTKKTADFICDTTTATTPNKTSKIKKYPPNITDQATRAIFDQLAVQCLNGKNQLVTDITDTDIVYGCYCLKPDVQISFENIQENPVETFNSQCNAAPNSQTRLTAVFQSACLKGNAVVLQSFPDKCSCPVNGSILTVPYADFVKFHEPVNAFMQRRNAVCNLH